MENSCVLNFGFIFEPEFSAEVIAASQDLSKEVKLDYGLGDRSLPHVTILQFRCETSSARDIWKILAPVRKSEIRLNFHGLAFDRWRSWDGVWLRLKYCPRIRKAQQQAVELLGAREYVNAIGDFYEPHATLAAWPKQDDIPPFELPAQLLDRKNIRGFYSLGISGPQYQFESILYTERKSSPE